MIVEGTQLAAELRRRRLGRAELHTSLTRTSSSTWVPGAELNEAPSELLMLAALSLADAMASPQQIVQPASPLVRGAPPDTSASW
jgi:hypothetical protein